MRLKLLLFVLLPLSLLAQTPAEIDSLVRRLPSLPDGEKPRALFPIVNYYARSDRSKAIVYRRQAIPYLQASIPGVRLYARLAEGIFYTASGRMDSAIYWLKLAKEDALKVNQPRSMAMACSALGRALITAGEPGEAVSNLMEGLRNIDKDPERELELKLRINLVWAYLELKRYRDGVDLGRKTMQLIDSAHTWIAPTLYNNIAVCYGALKRFDSAAYFVKKSLGRAKANQDNQLAANAYFILGNVYAEAGRYSEAIEQFEQAAPYREKAGNPFYIVADLYTLASTYEKTHQFDKGVQTALRALEVASRHNLLLKFENTYQVLAMNYEGLGDFKKASHYYALWAAAKDSVYRNANAEAIADMETRYQTEKKEQEIALQGATLQRTYIIIGALVLIVALIIVILLLNRSRYRRKQEVMRKEFELSVRETYISATIQSQENERKRFAQDLHDGMGQLISALRFMIGPHTTEATRTERVKQAEDVLNEMHREIRSVAFNLMPQILIRNGLVPALQEMAARLKETGKLKVSVSAFDITDRLPEVQEISLYRVVQEWINNIMKYARAKQVQVQLVRHDQEINLTIEDDGQGFDKSALDTTAGNGWKNIQSRLNLIHALWELDTRPGRQGTTFMISIPLSGNPTAPQESVQGLSV